MNLTKKRITALVFALLLLFTMSVIPSGERGVNPFGALKVSAVDTTAPNNVIFEALCGFKTITYKADGTFDVKMYDDSKYKFTRFENLKAPSVVPGKESAGSIDLIVSDNTGEYYLPLKFSFTLTEEEAAKKAPEVFVTVTTGIFTTGGFVTASEGFTAPFVVMAHDVIPIPFALELVNAEDEYLSGFPGEYIPIKAAAGKGELTFKNWTSDDEDGSFGDPTSNETYYIIGSRGAEITANYAKQFQAEITYTATGETDTILSFDGMKVPLMTDVPDGYAFVNWTSDTVEISNPTSPTGASFIMIPGYVSITANFKAAPAKTTADDTAEIIVGGKEIQTHSTTAAEAISDGEARKIFTAGTALAVITPDDDVIAGANASGSMNSASTVSALYGLIADADKDTVKIEIEAGGDIGAISLSTFKKLAEAEQKSGVDVCITATLIDETGTAKGLIDIPITAEMKSSIRTGISLSSESTKTAVSDIEAFTGNKVLASFATAQKSSFGTKVTFTFDKGILGLDNLTHGQTVYVAITGADGVTVQVKGVVDYTVISFTTSRGGVFMFSDESFVK